MEPAPPVTTRTVVSKASDRFLHLLYERPLLVLTMMFCTGVAIILWHNIHPESPKADWQEGDVRGVLEVILPLDMAVAQTQADLRGTFSLMTAMTAFGLLGLALVIGTVRRYTAAAPRLAAEAARANGVTRLKTAFVTLVSHELRTPLTSVTGDVELLLEGSGGPLTEAPRESLGMVQRNAEGLVKLIDALLDISRIEAGRVVRQRTPLDLVPRIQGVASSLRPQLEATGQRLAPDGQARRFTKFFRARHGASHGVGGTGLGLAITRALVELHGGVITVTNALGQGSAFSFTLPAVH